MSCYTYFKYYFLLQLTFIPGKERLSLLVNEHTLNNPIYWAPTTWQALNITSFYNLLSLHDSHMQRY